MLKVLTPKLISPYVDFQYELGKKYHCKDFDSDQNNTCSNGFYAIDVDGLSYAYRPTLKIYECEVSGKSVEIDSFKRRYEYIKIIEEADLNIIKEQCDIISLKLGYNIKESVFPFNPFSIVGEVTEHDQILLKKWASVCYSVYDSVYDSVSNSVSNSVWNSVGYSVINSVWASVSNSVRGSVCNSVCNSVYDSVSDSVRNSVWNSVSNSVWNSVSAYISSLFPNIKEWKYIDHKKNENPFQPGIDLWRKGLIPFYDGEKWRLHNKNEIVF